MNRLTPVFNRKPSFDWSDAFYKFGFDDGDGCVQTYEVAHALRQKGYDVKIGDTAIHNTVINSIKKDGCELLPLCNPTVKFGYDHARGFLPQKIITILDEAFPPENASPKPEIACKQEL